MKTKAIFVFFLLIYLAVQLPKKIYAEDKASGVSATLLQPSVHEVHDYRVEVLEKYFEKYNSPLVKSAPAFVAQADQNNIDWKLLPAISGVESTFAQAEPLGCNNAWGYNIFGTTVRCFTTYDQAIGVIAKDLRQTYMDKWGAKNVYDIGSHYAASPVWGYKVDHFMQELADFQFEQESKILPISL